VRRLALLCGAVALLTSVAHEATAQGSRCIFRIRRVGGQGVTQETPAGTNYFAGGGVSLYCQGTGVTMESDSVAAYAGDVAHFIGHVRYRDSTMALDADRGVYYQSNALWQARGRVVSRNTETGSELRGPSLDYYRTVTGRRALPLMVATGRPTIDYLTRDSSGTADEPYVIVADRVRLEGDDRMWAGGSVTIDRSDFKGRGDSLWLDTPGGQGALLGNHPSLEGIGEDPYRMTGVRLEFALTGSELTGVTAQDSAHAASGEWDLEADTIAVSLQQGAVRELEAWGANRRATGVGGQGTTVTADSLSLDFPEGMLSQLLAFGDGYLETGPDPVTGDPDWLAGDTVAAEFAPWDSAGTEVNRLRRVIARSTARSYRHTREGDDQLQNPNVNYVTADVIIITMAEPPADGVERVDMHGNVYGVTLEADSPAPEPPREADQPRPGPGP